ncbi:MAG: metal ABC transporter substrate-binding protein [Clostridia bacterium]|nr:metal ABC transporter substrate-binding protein [Clostridia bacterium]
MKKIISILLLFLTILLTFTGCGSNTFDFTNGKLSVVCTIFPEYDWVKQIVGDSPDVDVRLLIKNGVDLHSYQPSVEDIARISTCDLFVYVGGESDNWVNDVLKEAVNKDMVALNLLDVLGDYVKKEEEIDGMQEEHGHSHDENETAEYEEHVWLSLKNAELFVRTLRDTLCSIDKNNRAVYSDNAQGYLNTLSDIDGQYGKMAESAKRSTALFADRFPFRYLFDDYNISYYAAFKGCSSETEASFETITFLSDKINKLNLDCVLTLENSDDRIASAIIQASENKNAEILTLDSMQSTNIKDVESGTTYASIMQSNLETLRTALN